MLDALPFLLLQGIQCHFQDVEPVGRHVNALIGRQVLLESGNAFMDDYTAQNGPYAWYRGPSSYIGRADEVVPYVAARIGSPPQEAASASAAAVRSDENIEWSTTLLVLLSISTVALVGFTAAFAHHRILAPRRPSLRSND